LIAKFKRAHQDTSAITPHAEAARPEIKPVDTPSIASPTAAPLQPASIDQTEGAVLSAYPLTQSRLKAGENWLKKVGNDRWFIQLWAANATQKSEIERLLKDAAKHDGFDNIHLYFSSLSGKPRYGIIYGDYPTRTAATDAIEELPTVLKKNKPYPRQVIHLK
jgi:septal ring-binding cell division protein DamX